MDRTLLNNANIRKIIVGDAKDGFAFVVGQHYGKNRDILISRIVRDENAYFLLGAVTYIVYAKIAGKESAWKLFERQPIIAEFDTSTPEESGMELKYKAEYQLQDKLHIDRGVVQYK